MIRHGIGVPSATRELGAELHLFGGLVPGTAGHGREGSRPGDCLQDCAVGPRAETGLGGKRLLAEPLADIEVTAIRGLEGGDGDPHRVVGVIVGAGEGEHRLGGQDQAMVRLYRGGREVAQDGEGELDVAGVDSPLHRQRHVVLLGVEPPVAFELVRVEDRREQRGE